MEISKLLLHCSMLVVYSSILALKLNSKALKKKIKINNYYLNSSNLQLTIKITLIALKPNVPCKLRK